MEIAPKSQERDSPRSNGSCSNSNGSPSTHHQHPTPPATPKPVSRSESGNPYPTTFVQADTSSFKQVVQMLTGSSETAKHANSDPPAGAGKSCSIPPIRTGQNKKQGFKLYERRNSLKNGLMISPLPGIHHTSSFSPRNKPPEILSPSILDFPALVLSPVTPLNEETVRRSSNMEEERAIAEKKFYLHPSPRASTPRDSHDPPQLLPLFPVTSPRVSGSS